MRPYDAREVMTAPDFVQVQALRGAKIERFAAAASAQARVELIDGLPQHLLEVGNAIVVDDVLGAPRGGFAIVEVEGADPVFLVPWLDPSLLGLKILGDAAAIEIAHRAGMGLRPQGYWCRADSKTLFPRRLLTSLGFRPQPGCPEGLEKHAELLVSDGTWWRLDADRIAPVISRALAIAHAPLERRTETGRKVDVLFDHWLIKPEQENFRQEVARSGRTSFGSA